MNALISVKTVLHSEEGRDEMEFVTEGQYNYGGGVITIDYMESELTGMAGTHTVFKVTDRDVTLTREGDINTHVLYRAGEKHYFAYNTPMGMMTMGVDTRSVTNRLGIHGGMLGLHYNIDVHGAAVSSNEVTINVKEVK